MTVIMARYVPITTPVAKISGSFQLSGKGDGLTLSFEIVMIVPSQPRMNTRTCWNVAHAQDLHLAVYCVILACNLAGTKYQL
jgi:hypothetical protein